MTTLITLTRPTLVARIKRAWRLRQLRRALAGAMDDYQHSLTFVKALEGAPHENMSDAGKRLAALRLHEERLVMVSDEKRVNDLQAQIDHLELGGF
jgi:hypothetical protein